MTPTESAFRLDGRLAMITGGGQGIGEATALALADAGADVAILARTQKDLESVAEQVRGRGREALVLPGDVNDLDFLAEAVAATVSRFGRIDVLVNNAGGSMSRPFTKTTVAQLEASFHFNVSAAFELSRLALPHLLDGGGAIVNIGSVAARMSPAGETAYSASKAALTAFSEGLAVELWDGPVSVHVLHPGIIETELFSRPDNDESYADDVEPLPASTVVDALATQLSADTFEAYLPEWFDDIASGKFANMQGFLSGSAEYVRAKLGSTADPA